MLNRLCTVVILGWRLPCSLKWDTAYNVDIDDEFSKFRRRYLKVYRSKAELLMRKVIFTHNLHYIVKNNKKNAHQVRAKMGINEYADLTPKEWEAKKSGAAQDFSDLRGADNIFRREDSDDDDDDDPILGAGNDEELSTVDWTKRDAVTMVETQGDCGGCWAFVVSSSIETQRKIRFKVLEKVSRQQLLELRFE